jgi:hypothetical protein
MKRIKVATGFSRLTDDSFKAGRDAALAAVNGIAGEDLSLVIVFTTPQFNLPELLRGIRSITGKTPLIGATSCGQLTSGNFSWFGGGVSVLVMTAGPYRFGIASVAGIKGNLDNAGQIIARESKRKAGASPSAAILLLVDCLAGDLQQLLRGVYRITGPNVAIIGGAASDEMKFRQTFVFHDDDIIEQGAVALWVASDSPLQVITRHGWKPIGGPLLITEVRETEIVEIDGRPAAVVYEEQLGFSPGQLGKEDFWPTAVLHPLGLLQQDGGSVIRVAREKSASGSLVIQGCVPPTGSAVQVMASSIDDLLDITEEVAAVALADATDAGLLLVFSCAARAIILGTRVAEEAKRLQNASGDMTTFGMYCCGEFARTAGVLGTHNATLTAIAL